MRNLLLDIQNNKPAFNLGLIESAPHQVRAMLLFVTRDLTLDNCPAGDNKTSLHSRNFYATKIHRTMFECIAEFQGIHSRMATGHFHSLRPNVGDTYDQEAIAQFRFSKESFL